MNMRISRNVVTAGLLVILALVAMSCGGSDETEAADASKETLACGTDPSYRPYAFYDEEGNLVGFDIDLCKEYAERLGLELDLQLYGFAGLIPALQAGQIDVEPEMAFSEERAETVDFSNPLLTQSVVAIVPKDDTDFNPASIEELEGLKVGLHAGSTSEVALSKTDLSTVAYQSQPDSFEDLLLGRIDVVVTGNLNGGYEVANTYPDELRVSDTNLTGGGIEESIDVAATVQKGNTEFLERLNEVIGEMHDDGTMESLVKKWFGDIPFDPEQ